ncbi:MAG: MraY family glycosyltransferase [Bacteroidota bacterium]
MEHLKDIFLAGTISMFIGICTMPLLRRLARQLKLVDKPNFRKLHTSPIPLVGGICIAMSTWLTMLLIDTFTDSSQDISFLLAMGLILLVLGIIDDKWDIPALSKLIIQLLCAGIIAWSGIRISSLYGIFGIYDIPVGAQYLLTVVVITGVVNAFNLMDGIDGLAGSLAVLGFLALAILSCLMGKYTIAILYAAIIGSVIGFLRFNLSQKKTFLGDGGSLFLGFILVVSGIQILEWGKEASGILPDITTIMVIGIFMIPVLDSLRVYRGRIGNGDSPFTPDKSHLHHLFLLLGLTHVRTSLFIVITSLLLLTFSAYLAQFLSVTLVIGLYAVLFLLLTNLLTVNKQMVEWQGKVQHMEQE